MGSGVRELSGTIPEFELRIWGLKKIRGTLF